MRKILFAIFVSLVVATVCFAESKAEPNIPTAKELLGKYAENQDKIHSYQIIADVSLSGATNRPPSTGKVLYNYYRTETCFDGNRLSFKLDRWMNMSTKPEDTSSLSKDYEHFIYSRLLWDGENNYTFSEDNELVHLLKIDKTFTNNDVLDFYSVNSPEAEMSGFFPGNRERIDKVLKNQALDIKVRDKIEKTGKFTCYVIDATTETTEYTLWIAPECGYNIVKAYRRKELPEDSYAAHGVMTIKHLEKINDIWIPMESVSKGGATWGKYYSRGTMEIKRTKVVLDPNHDELQSFELDKVPNGTKVLIRGIPNAYTWRDGKVVDKDGKVIMDCRPKKSNEKD